MNRFILSLAATFLTASAAAAFEIDRDALTPVRWQFDLVMDGQIDGSWDFNITDDGEVVHMFGATSWPSQNTFESDSIELRSSDLFPIVLDVDGDFDGTAILVDATWTGEAITGTMSIQAADAAEPTIHPIEDVALPLTRVSTFGSIRGALLSSGDSGEISWFSTHDGGNRTVQMSVGEETTVTVPAGTFDVLPVTLTGEDLTNILYVTTTLPRDLVRVDVVGMPMVFELRSVTQPE